MSEGKLSWTLTIINELTFLGCTVLPSLVFPDYDRVVLNGYVLCLAELDIAGIHRLRRGRVW